MNEKLSFQHIAESLSQKSGVSKKVSEQFSKAFFDTIVDALYMGEETIKIKGLGTFKLIDVESRESIDVNTGDRIVISGYKKVSFTPEDSVVEKLNSKKIDTETDAIIVAEPLETMVDEPAPVEDPASVEEPVTVPIAESKEDSIAEETIIDEINAEEPQEIEKSTDEFAGIDFLISTPESIEDIRQQYEKAKSHLDQIVEEAKKANSEKVRLEKLLERLESNSILENHTIVEETPTSEDSPVCDAPEVTVPAEHKIAISENESVSTEESTNVTTENTNASTENTIVPEEIQKKNSVNSNKNKTKKWIVSVVFLLVAGIIFFFIYKTSTSIESVEKVSLAEQKIDVKNDSQPTKEKNIVNPKDSVKTNQQNENSNILEDKAKEQKETKVENNDVAETKEPKIHIIQRGESLTKISQRYYGTKDSVNSIIRLNAFTDPNNVPIGAKVFLP